MQTIHVGVSGIVAEGIGASTSYPSLSSLGSLDSGQVLVAPLGHEGFHVLPSKDYILAARSYTLPMDKRKRVVYKGDR
jgi:hypothetical protein